MTPSVRTTAPRLAEEALQLLDEASSEHLEWLKRIHCSLLFRGGERRPTTHCPAVEDGLAAMVKDTPGEKPAALARLKEARQHMEDVGRDLTEKAARGEPLHPDAYMAFMGAVEAYHAEGRHLELLLHQALAETDPLTGLLNRRGMIRDLRREWVRATRNDDPCCLALADIDHFKEVNDAYGHMVGDQVLAMAARFFLRRLRPYDLVYRFGGEEFLFCLPHSDIQRAKIILDRLRVMMPRMPFRSPDGRRIPVTISIGLAAMSPGIPPETAISRADDALYRAKEGGRNRVCVAGQDNLTPSAVDESRPRREAHPLR
jgi:diguanylate cyclase